MKKIKNTLLVSFSTVLIIFVGCSSESVVTGNNNHISEMDISGLEVLHDGKPIAFVENGTVYGTVIVDMNQNSEVYEVEFFDENGELINNDSQALKLAWRYNEPQIATIDHLEEQCKWGFCIKAKQQGNTSFKLSVENSDDTEYLSPDIPLEVR